MLLDRRRWTERSCFLSIEGVAVETVNRLKGRKGDKAQPDMNWACRYTSVVSNPSLFLRDDVVHDSDLISEFPSPSHSTSPLRT